MRISATLVACAVLAGAILTPAAAQEELDVAPAIAAAEAWLKDVDAGRYNAAWGGASELFRQRVPREEWEKAIVAAREPLGPMGARKLQSAKYLRTVPGAPDGEYVVIEYRTTFARKLLAIETVTPMRDRDGAWRVSGYYVR